MLFGYPPEANKDNWVHEFLYELIKGIYLRTIIVKSLEMTLKKWDDIIPQTYREQFTQTKTKNYILKLVEHYYDIYQELDSEEKNKVYQALETENQIPSVLSGKIIALTINDLPVAIQEPISRLYGYFYDKLSDFNAWGKDKPLRDLHYEIIYNSLESKICPFCGLEPFDAPYDAPRHDLDHYLKKEDYPFAAVNLYNLVPTGDRCNQKYKFRKSVIFNENNEPTKAFYAYGSIPKIQVIIKNDLFPKGSYENNFSIEFLPKQEEVDSWDRIFSVKTRYIRDIVKPRLKKWLMKFGLWAKGRDQVIVELLNEYIKNLQVDEFEDFNFIKIAFFLMLLEQVNQENNRVIKHLERHIQRRL